MAQVNVVLSTMMGGVSGSAVADASMQARILGHNMVKQRLPKGIYCRNYLSFSFNHRNNTAESWFNSLWFVGEVSIGRLL